MKRTTVGAHAVGLVVGLMLTLSAYPLAAQSVSPDPPMYRQAVDQAVAEYEAGNFQESRALFTKAHQLFPNARTWRGLAMTEFEMRNYIECVRGLESALTSQVRTLEGALRQETEALLERARTFVAQVRFEVSPAASRVVVDGFPLVFTVGTPVLLSVGDHVIEVEAPGYTSERRALSLKGGGEQTLSIGLQALTSSAPATSALIFPAPAIRQLPPAGEAQSQHPRRSTRIVNLHLNLLGPLQLGLIPRLEIGLSTTVLLGAHFLNTGLVSLFVLPDEDDKLGPSFGGNLGLRHYFSGEGQRGFYVGGFVEYAVVVTRDTADDMAEYRAQVIIPGADVGYRWVWARFLLDLGGMLGVGLTVAQDDKPLGEEGCVYPDSCPGYEGVAPVPYGMLVLDVGFFF